MAAMDPEKGALDAEEFRGSQQEGLAQILDMHNAHTLHGDFNHECRHR